MGGTQCSIDRKISANYIKGFLVPVLHLILIGSSHFLLISLCSLQGSQERTDLCMCDKGTLSSYCLMTLGHSEITEKQVTGPGTVHETSKFYIGKTSQMLTKSLSTLYAIMLVICLATKTTTLSASLVLLKHKKSR